MPALAGTTDGSITTTSFSPEELRSPPQTRTASAIVTHPHTPPLFGRGCSVPPSSSSTASRIDPDQPQTARLAGRNFPASATAPLREWFQHNVRDPYPTKETKQRLADVSGLTVLQVNNWFINQRKRSLPREQRTLYGPNYTTSPELLPNQLPTTDDYHGIVSNPPFGTDLGPFDSDLGALPSAQQPWTAPDPLTLPLFQNFIKDPLGSDALAYPPPSSAGSGSTAIPASDCRVPISISARTSPITSVVPRTRSTRGPVFPRSQEVVLGSRRGRKRQVLSARADPAKSRALDAAIKRERTAQPSTNEESGTDSSSERDAVSDKKAGEIFQCTFPGCGKSFSSKTWKRHEETKHLPRFQWTCMASGFLCHDGGAAADSSAQVTPNLSNPFLLHTSPAARLPTCIFCQQPVGSAKDHPAQCPFRLHDCLSRPPAERTFTRKDHLFQHLRNFHRFTPPDGSFGMEWKSRVEYAGRTWGCGFCGERLASWERRARHLRGHFREGWRMESGWDEAKARGACWGGGGRV